LLSVDTPRDPCGDAAITAALGMVAQLASTAAVIPTALRGTPAATAAEGMVAGAAAEIVSL
jgi:hypothetical protein